MTELLDKNQLQEVETFRDQYQPPDEIQGDEVSKYTLRAWWSVLQANRFQSYKQRALLYERALKYVPGCYKLWHNYLQETIDQINYKSVLSQRYEKLNELFERALKYMERMPKIWLIYSEQLIKQKKISKTRETFDKALRSLPITQHSLIWDVYINWVMQLPCVRTAKYVITRFLKIEPDFKEEYAEYLVSHKDYDNAAKIYYDILKDDSFFSKNGRSHFQFYIDLSNMIIERANEITSINCEEVIKEGLSKYVDEVGNLWAKLASYYIKQGNFTKARASYEDGINSIMTARDFGIIYNAYLKFEEEVVNALALNDDDEDQVDDEEIEKQLDRIESLIARRQKLLNAVYLRQNENSIQDWIQKIQLYKDDENEIQGIFQQALALDPQKIENGHFSDIWIQQAIYYQEKGDLKNSNLVFHAATKIKFKTAYELSQIWIFWVEMLIKEEFFEDALTVVKQSLHKSKDAEYNLHMNLDLWALYIDLERNLGTFETIKTAYKRVTDLKVVTPFILLNYANFLEDNKYFEESFKIFETGLTLFTWPSVYDIWIIYIRKFVKRYQGDKLERARDLFEKVLSVATEKFSKIFYLMYAQFEEEFGLLNHAFEIYDRMVASVDYKDKLEAYNIYISKISHYLGITKSRPIFENAIQNFSGKEVIDIGMRFSHLERKFGEIDRARAIYIHISQYTDPKDDDQRLWKVWHDFEVHHGNIDTFREFMRIKRTVLAKFSLMPPDIKKIQQRVEEEFLKNNQFNTNN